MSPWFSTLNEFFSMSGYGGYVWTSFLLGVGAVILNAWLATRSLANAREQARRRLEMNP